MHTQSDANQRSGGSRILKGGFQYHQRWEHEKSVRVGGAGGGLKKSAPPPARSAETFFTKCFKRASLMGSLQISTGSALGKVVHAVGLWP